MSDKLKCLDPDSIVKLDINGKFYGDIKASFTMILISNNESKESMGKIIDNISSGKVTTEKERILYPLFYLLVGLEESAKEQGYIIETDAPNLDQDNL